MWQALALVAAAAALSVWSWSSARQKLRERIRRDWGRPRRERADMDNVADYFRSDAVDGALDDRTWADLLLDDVFAHLDRTESSVGQQILYCRLRCAGQPRSLSAFDALVVQFAHDVDARERAQTQLARLRHSSAYYVHRLARGTIVRPAWYAIFPLWTALVALSLALAIVWHGFVLVAILGFGVNAVIRVVTAQRVGSEAVWFRQVGPLMSAARSLAELCDRPSAAAITGRINADLGDLRRLGAIARWVGRGNDSGAPTDIVGALIEYINIQLLMDVNALYFASRDLESRGAQLLRLIEAVGEIDAAIAVASFRTSLDEWVRPQFLAADTPACLSEIRHPLVEDAVPNSITLAHPAGVLVTGSNMSGKSTFLRTVGVNAVLAQTINTCLARRYEAPVYQVRSCIGREDDLVAGKSYYLVEVESVLALVRASQATAPHLFIFDELFRGTNAVERIAAGEAVLRALLQQQRHHVVLAATHDGELVELLSGSYAVYHFGDSIGPNGLSFDYHLTPGPATSRNAIALLQLNGAPESLVAQALSRATELDQRRAASRQI